MFSFYTKEKMIKFHENNVNEISIDNKFLLIYAKNRVCASSLNSTIGGLFMYHTRGSGTHYEIGFAFGSRLKKFGIALMDTIPFEINQERIQFSKRSLPLYEKYAPEIIEEIKGISDGNVCCYELLCAVIVSMYCIMPEEVHCSCMAVRNQHGVYFARNSDFLTNIEKLYSNTMYRFTDDGYAFQANTTAFVEMEDGVNEHGLIIGLTSVYPKQLQPGLHAGILLRLFLERCKCVEEVITLLQELPIASSQTFTCADQTGIIACIECSSSKIEVYKPDSEYAYVCATNRFHLTAMRDEVVDVSDDWFAKERYQTMKKVLDAKYKHMNVEDCMKVMAGKEGFICQYDRSSGKDTVWSIVYDVKQKAMYRVEGNPARKVFKQDKRFTMIKQDI